MSKKARVLISSFGSTPSLNVFKGLRAQNEFEVNIIGIDTNKKDNLAGSQLCDKFFTVPFAKDESSYIETVMHIIREEGVELFIPMINIELEILAKNREKLETIVFLLLSSSAAVAISIDKMKMYNFFIGAEIPTPKTIAVEDLNNMVGQVRSSGMRFPIIVKPRNGLSSRDVYEIRDEQEICLVRRIKDPIIQEKASGQEYTIDVFFDKKNLIAAVPRKRIDTRAGISYKGETEHDSDMIKYAEIISERLQINGPANIQCFKDEKGIKFTELNLRFSGGLPLTIAAGVNTPLLALKMAKGEKLTPITSFKKLRMCRLWQEVFYEI